MEARDVTEHEVGMLHADIQRLREQIGSWVKWGITLFAGAIIAGLVGLGMTLQRVEENEQRSVKSIVKTEQVESRVAKLEGDRDLLGERMSTLRDAILMLSADVREMLSRERERGAGWRGGKQE